MPTTPTAQRDAYVAELRAAVLDASARWRESTESLTIANRAVADSLGGEHRQSRAREILRPLALRTAALNDSLTLAQRRYRAAIAEQPEPDDMFTVVGELEVAVEL